MGFEFNNMARSRLTDVVKRMREHYAVPGLAVAGRKSHEALSTAAGQASMPDGEPMSAGRRLPISCVMKVLLAWVVIYLDSEGRLSVDDDIGDYVPRLLRPGEFKSGIRLRHLLTHTAGYIEPQENSARWGYTLERFLDFFPTRKQVFEPGHVWSYTHTGHTLLQMAVEHVTGRSLRDTLAELVFDPLELPLVFMSDGKAAGAEMATLHIRGPRGDYHPMRPPQETGFLRYSISDAMLSAENLATVGHALAGGAADKLAYLEPARKRLLTSAIDLPAYISGQEGEIMPRAFCHGVADYGVFKGINGSYVGSTCALRVYEPLTMGLAAVINAYEPHVRDVAARMLGSSFGKPETVAAAPAVENLDRMVGTYEGLMLTTAMAEIVRKGNALEFTVRFKGSGGMSGRFIQTGEGMLRLEAGSKNLAMAFANDPEGNDYLMVATSAFRRVAA